MHICNTNAFQIGGLDQEELSFEVNFFVASDPSVEHLHNQLVAGIYGNVGRDSPEPGIAPWVSANDKPTIVSKPVTGDAAEQRLKTEVMQLPGKDRRRLKVISEVCPRSVTRQEARALMIGLLQARSSRRINNERKERDSGFEEYQSA